MLVNNITCLLDFCLKSTYFTYQGKHFEQLEWAAMGPHQPICSNPQLLKQEEDHLYTALSRCKYPAWALKRIKIKSRNPTKKKNNNNQNNPGTDSTKKPHIIVPYHR